MKIGIELNLNVVKIQKDRIKVTENGKFLNLTVFLDTEKESKYGDHGMILHSTTKEEREQGLKLPIIGNGKVFYVEDGQPKQNAQQDPGYDDENIPF
jgi:hypothetical protein